MTQFDRLRLQRSTRHLHMLGPRAVTELLLELAQHFGDSTFVFDRLAAYCRLTPEHVGAAGGYRIPHSQLRLVPQS